MQMLEATADSLANSMRQAALASQGVNPAGYAQAARAMKLSSQVARDAAASTGMWAAEQLKLNTAADDYNKKLEARKLSLRDIKAQSKVAQAAYREQLALQQMVVRSAGKVGGRELFDVYTPTGLHKSLDTTAMKFGFLREQIASASHQMVNWGKNTQWAGRQLMVGLTMPVAAFGAAAGVMAYQVEDELTRIQKVIDTNAQAIVGDQESMMAVEKELAQVRIESLATARKAASDYASAGVETLQVQADLAAIGLKGVELQKQTNEVMRIATLGELDRQTSTEMAIALQSVWRMSNEELADSFNYLNAIENATSLSTQDFATAIPIAAAPMKAWGGDIKELGILLTTMRERGIQAGKAANAIKATMQRLGRPSKQIREEFQALTGESITELIEKGTSLTDTFRLIGEATEDLSANDKKKAFAGLFGSYQVTTMMAMTEGVMELEKGIGQAAKAAEIASMSTQSWADTAAFEIERMMKSPAKVFKAELEELKLNMAAFGEPFLVVAAGVMKAINAILVAFNQMPQGVKIIAGLTIGMLALAGPVIMLVGLFANLAGNLGKFFVMATRSAVKFELLNKESAAAKIAQELAQQGFVETGTAVRDLTMKLDALVLAYRESNAAAALALGQRPAPTNLGVAHGPALAGATTAAAATSKVADATDDIADNSKKIQSSWATSGKLMGGASAAMMVGAASSSSWADSLSTVAMTALGVSSVFSMFGGKMPKFNRDAGTAKVLWSGIGNTVKSLGSRLLSILKFLPQLVKAIHPIGWIAAAALGTWKMISDQQEKAVEDQRKLNNSADVWSKHLGYQKEEWKKIGRITHEAAADTKTMMENAALLRANAPEIVEGYMNQGNAAGKTMFAEQQYLNMRLTGASEEKALQGINQLFLATGMSIEDASAAMADFRKHADKLEELNRAEKSLKAVNNEMKLFDNQKFWKKRSDDFGWMNMQMFWEVPENFFASVFRDEEEEAYNAGAGAADEFADGLARMKNPLAKGQYWDKAIKQINAKWKPMLDQIGKETMANLASSGVDTTNTDALKQVIIDADTYKWEKFRQLYTSASYNDWMRLNSMAAGEAEKLGRWEKGLTETIRERTNATGDATMLYTLQKENAGDVLGLTLEQVKTQYRGNLEAKKRAVFSAHELKLGAELNDKQKLQVLNQMRVNLGLKRTGNLLDGFGPATVKWERRQSQVNNKLREARQLALQLMKALDQDAIIGATKDAFSSFQQGVADATLRSFEGRQSRAMEQLEADAESRTETFENNAEAATERLSKRHDAALRGMENRHEAAQNRLENMQESRRRRVEAGFDNRIKKIQNVIEAEERAEEIRKRIFEAEQTRLSRLTETANRTIDFNVAINSGNLDEAAKIRNDMESTASSWALGDAADRGERKAARRREKLEGRIDHIEEARDKRLDALARVEEAEKKSLDRRLEREKRFLEKQQELEKERLEDRQEANRKALDKELENTRKNEENKWEKRRAYLEKALDDFTGYIATSDKDLKRHIKIWEKEHKGLSLTTKGQFNRTSDAINAYIKDSVTKAGKQIVNEANWELNGWNIAKKMMDGAFGMTPSEFRKFIATGEPPKGWGDKPAERPNAKLNQRSRQADTGFTLGGVQARHTGGEIGGVGGSRKGYARTMNMHRNEQMVLAERGEYMVNKNAAKKHRGLLETINAGKDSRLNKGYGIGGGGLGVATMFGMMMAGALRRSIENGIMSSGAIATARLASTSSGSYGAAAAGKYGDSSFTAEQLGHAATIASVGKSLGASKRDIQIALMTAMQESTLRNLDWGDRDSVGLFQQRAAWGSFADRTNPKKSARMFFLGGAAGQRGLFDFPNRGSMSLAEAAQAVQVSAYPDAYAKWADEAAAIMKAMTSSGGGFNAGGYVAGKGGWSRPSVPGKGWSNTHDYRNGIGSPLYAHSDGTVVESRAVTSGGSPGNGLYSTPYRSYGETIAIRGADGKVFRYAHLSPGARFVRAGQKVKGGSLIGRSGNTGNSSGPHTHFDVDGNYNASGYLAARGISLRKGAENIRWDNTIANLHKGEAVLTKDISAKFREGVDRFANGGETTYNLNMNFGSVSDKDEIAQHVIKTIKRAEARKPRSRSGR